ncbi:hypothetical protein [Palleronia sp. LCG004]|uniref:hypothetical protein n=1 Tax=Palleronia sp. LCG004 TaxID=3079304 RepID=UPI002943EE59|nr:hypothetical protein [Palleronia sp. LCG004]WOI57260.1 hypothetical protein RVY76_05605 [Palleronia sp. LCG004]
MTIRTLFSVTLAALLLTGCAQMNGPSGSGTVPTDRDGQASPPPEEIAEIVAAPPPRAGARTADQFDTTTDAQRQAARAAPTGGEQRLGEVVASLGDPTEPGLWVKTALVDAQRSGRLEYPGSGQSAVVELRPLPGGGGAQVSLAAMRLLEAPLTDLPTLIVYGN